VFWCFHCYAVNDHPSGSCRACGQPIEAPAGLTYHGRLIWALRHPDGDRAVVAAQTLGRLRARESVPALREAVEAGPDTFLRAEALRSLIAIEGVEPLRPWLEALSRNAPFNVRRIAQEALNGRPSGDIHPDH
jgi:HEAT repeat protein